MLKYLSAISLYIICCSLSATGAFGGNGIGSASDAAAVAVAVHGGMAADTLSGINDLIRTADSMRREYRFDEASVLYTDALKMTSDSLKRMEIEDGRLLCENGMNMANFVYSPTVVSRKTVSVKDFYLYYPMADKSWRANPCALDSTMSHRFANAAYVEDGVKEIYFSAEGEDGSRNLMFTEFNDTLWTNPALLNEQLVSYKDEVFPVLSQDGKSLYFSSNGLYGVGGYDIYVSNWNPRTRDWDTPVNLGFPYSSPADDLLYLNTPDGEYTIFASNRDCPADSVCIYVLAYDNMPIRTAVSDMEQLKLIMSLEPVKKKAEDAPAGDNIPENADTRRYVSKMSEIKSLKDSIYIYDSFLNECRALFAMSDDVDQRSKLTAEIIRRESMLPIFQDSLERASVSLQQIELEFLFKGIVINPEQLCQEEKAEAEQPEYSFVKNSFGPSLEMTFEKPADDFDYSFMILPEGRFAKDNTIPAGIVYQIQLFSLSKPATIQQLKGLSPVFLNKTSSGRYNYSVGVFRTYNDVLSNINKVKKLGFKNAYIIAYVEGQSVSVNSARALEKK